ncbi:hypothetical protein [Halotia branconii]|uniref:Uncharacterized protein n=1 Tax=Halotia branconii CENA392 TaxID=1539056 RepID=A0AAJ6NQZ0_9CYAN|nr:hypothetical protein [Halotia branconii]WGV24977.1 hypothetical protein QI031_24940 [Halotia branconii CENA392]
MDSLSFIHCGSKSDGDRNHLSTIKGDRTSFSNLSRAIAFITPSFHFRTKAIALTTPSFHFRR